MMGSASRHSYQCPTCQCGLEDEGRCPEMRCLGNAITLYQLESEIFAQFYDIGGQSRTVRHWQLTSAAPSGSKPHLLRQARFISTCGARVSSPHLGAEYVRITITRLHSSNYNTLRTLFRWCWKILAAHSTQASEESAARGCRASRSSRWSMSHDILAQNEGNTLHYF